MASEFLLGSSVDSSIFVGQSIKFDALGHGLIAQSVVQVPLVDSGSAAPVYLKLQEGAQGLVIFMHGNGEHLHHSSDFLNQLARRANVHVVAVEYPRYGVWQSCEDSPTEKSVNRTVQAVFDHFVTNLGVRSDHVFLIGRSVGSGPAAQLASQCSRNGTPLAGLMLVSPYTSILAVGVDASRSMKAWWSALVPPTWLAQAVVKNRWRSDKNIRHVQCPLLLVHGTQDELIPFEHSEALKTLYRGPSVELHPVACGHNGWELLDVDKMTQFIQTQSAMLDASNMPNLQYSQFIRF